MQKLISQEEAIKLIAQTIGRKPGCLYRNKREAAKAVGVGIETMYKSMRGECHIHQRILDIAGLEEVRQPSKFKFKAD